MKSMTVKMYAFIGGAILLAMVCVAAVTTVFVADTVIEDSNYIMQDTNEKTIAYSENYFVKYINLMQQMARDKNITKMISSNITKSNFQVSTFYDDVFATLQDTALSDPSNILTVYVAKASSNFAFDNEGWISDEEFNLPDKSYWFKSSEDIKKGYILTEPYFDSAANSVLMTVAAPIYDDTNTEIIGVTCVDLDIAAVCDMVTNSASSYDNGYQALISGEGYILAHKDQSKLLKSYSEIWPETVMSDQIKAAANTVFSFNDESVKSVAVVDISDISGWKIANIVPEKEYKAATSRIVRIIVFINIIAILIIGVVILIISKSISKPLKRLTGITDQLAGGDLDVSIDINSRDEVGRLAASMKVLTEKLKTYIAYINEISEILRKMGEGDLIPEFRQSYDGDFAMIKDALDKTSDRLSDTLSQIDQAAEQVSSGSDQVSSGAQALSQGATEQAGSIEELSATINQVSEQIQLTAENAVKAKQISEDTYTSTSVGQQQMQDMVRAMDEINNTSNEIGKIIKNIDDIAFQTNILALNAAVEAARAGAAGKGFAVVADEVRNLASKSAESAKNTASLIESARAAISNGAQIVQGAARSLDEVVVQSGKSAEVIQDIADASSQQAEAIEQVNQGVEQILAVVQNNSATAEESAAASEQLSAQAQMLKELIEGFRLKKQ